MEQSARAPATPVANGKLLPGRWLAVLGALALTASAGFANAKEAVEAPSVTGAVWADAALQPLPSETTSPNLIFALNDTAIPALHVPTRSIRLAAVSAVVTKPVLAPKKATGKRRSTLVFGSLGKPVSMSPVTARWTRALSDFQAEDTSSRHQFKVYEAILDRVSTKRRGLQIPQINAMVNRMLSYKEDAQLWQNPEYWASPSETLGRLAGDCEDYAILKYALLRDLGVKDEDMRIVVLRDTAVRQYHAVLTVRHKDNWLVLDNRFSRVRFERDLPNYRALYSVNASGEWSHSKDSGNPIRLAARLKSATN